MRYPPVVLACCRSSTALPGCRRVPSSAASLVATIQNSGSNSHWLARERWRPGIPCPDRAPEREYPNLLQCARHRRAIPKVVASSSANPLGSQMNRESTQCRQLCSISWPLNYSNRKPERLSCQVPWTRRRRPTTQTAQRWKLAGGHWSCRRPTAPCSNEVLAKGPSVRHRCPSTCRARSVQRSLQLTVNAVGSTVGLLPSVPSTQAYHVPGDAGVDT